MKVIRWKFKDGSRRHWTVEAWDSGERRTIDDSHEVDWVWSYQIYWENSKKPLYWGAVTGQIDNPPNLQTLLLDWLADLNSVVVDGCVRHEREVVDD